MITLGSLFDGIGGWQLAAVKNGVKPLWSSEIDPLNCYACIDVYVVNRDGTKEKVYDQAVLRTNEEYDNYLVKRISPHEFECGNKIEIEIEQCEEESTQEGK